MKYLDEISNKKYTIKLKMLKFQILFRKWQITDPIRR